MAHLYRKVGGRDFEEAIALVDNVQFEVDSRAIQIAEAAENLLRDHRVQGIAHIELAKGDIDSYVELVDSNVTNNETAQSNSSLSIEFGRAGFIDPDTGEEWGAMEGLHILTTAAHLPRKNGPKSKRRKLKKSDALLGGG